MNVKKFGLQSKSDGRVQKKGTPCIIYVQSTTHITGFFFICHKITFYYLNDRFN